jgi:hypothetical protein
MAKADSSAKRCEEDDATGIEEEADGVGHKPGPVEEEEQEQSDVTDEDSWVATCASERTWVLAIEVR